MAENYRFDQKGNRLVWSNTTGTWVMDKSAAALAKEARSEYLRKQGDMISSVKDTARSNMAKRRAARKRAARVSASTLASQVPKPKPKEANKPTVNKDVKPISTKTTKPTNTSRNPSRPASQSKAPAKKKAAPAVSQSRTMWVKKGEMVNGKEVKKGYLAQYGKPEKRVTGPVKLVEATKRGKAGETVNYKKGRFKKKGGK